MKAHTKKTTDHATARHSEAIQAQRRLHQEQIREMEANDGVFLAETGGHLAMARYDAR